ncbi:MAG TPA: crotonase/enoyl-CoA hydratase family protein [Alcanivorax sp.]|nr:enoyl-CoA hydratase [Alcanivorax sp.]MBF48049.1 enoyl-CoA hydratase [Alcanivorax sp.]MBT74682.1 enoyl-CoA hydratase [Alcanivorax sp.]HAD46212.1 crotonase/enoyl-CoA hydratase family protein [Alcanivorax sp.]HBP92654.1 crotonase/enoyl-CoA hydratase family protein [Alcanivorax sp.]|tara:strand:- start:49 stop:897 length:849 start_codon:yes stop_codon:yes gene_type:complete
MSYKTLTVTTDGHIARITLDRPDRLNAMNADFWNELPAAVRALDAGGDVRAIVIDANGKHFTAGLDLGMFGTPPDPADVTARVQKAARFRHNTALMQQTFSALEDCRVPVIAALHGGCIGGGVDLISACDLRYASRDAYLTVYEINVGLTADVGTFPRLCKLLPEGIVRELAYTGRRMGAEEGERRGLFNEVLDSKEAALERALEMAKEIAGKSPLAVHGCKRMITYARDHNTADSLDYVVTWNAGMLHSEEVMAAVTAGKTGQPGDYVPLPPLNDDVQGGV